MSLAEFRALPFWTDAYLADTDHLTDAEHGRYLLILIALWRAPEQRIPNDDAWLARKFRRSIERVRAELRPLIYEFCKTDGNWIYQKRLSREAEHLKKTSTAQSARAKSRWNKETNPPSGNAARHPPGNASVPYRTDIPPYPLGEGDSDLKIDGAEKPSRAAGTNPRAVEAAADEERARARHADRIATWRQRLAEYAETGAWPSAWGAMPDAAGRKTGEFLPAELRPEFLRIVPRREKNRGAPNIAEEAKP